MSQPDQRNLQALASLKLTPREAEVLCWISEGKSNQEISLIVGASTGTIRKHVEHILQKLNVENRTTAAVIAIEQCHSLARDSGNGWPQPRAAIVGLVISLAACLSNACQIYDVTTCLVA
jgi:DNA-binding CsgD family transcriptional regulator